MRTAQPGPSLGGLCTSEPAGQGLHRRTCHHAWLEVIGDRISGTSAERVVGQGRGWQVGSVGFSGAHWLWRQRQCAIAERSRGSPS